MVQTVGVLGCGTMGTGLVEAAARAGFQVVAVRARGGDPSKARARVEKSLTKRVSKGKMTEEECAAVLGRVTWGETLEPLAACDLVVECALEEMGPKLACLQEAERHMSDGAVLASNTSSLPLSDLAEQLQRPAQFLALHFFNPVPAMKLCELAGTDYTAPGAIASARGFAEAIGKTVVEVAGSPGYVVNRLLVPYLLHAIDTLESEIADAPSIDEAMKLGCGHPMGPLALADFIGLDVVLAMATTLQAELMDSRYRLPTMLRRLVAAGHLGRKSGLGIYDYTDSDDVVNPALRDGLPSEEGKGEAGATSDMAADAAE